jgi:hypothetical protein
MPSPLFTAVQKSAFLNQIHRASVSRYSQMFVPVTVKSLSNVPECSHFADTLFGLLPFASMLTYGPQQYDQTRTKTHYRREGRSYPSTSAFSAALAPARRPNTAPAIRPLPPG